MSEREIGSYWTVMEILSSPLGFTDVDIHKCLELCRSLADFDGSAAFVRSLGANLILEVMPDFPNCLECGRHICLFNLHCMS